MVLDRFFLWIFTIACFAGTCAIILQAPSLYDERRPLDQSYGMNQSIKNYTFLMPPENFDTYPIGEEEGSL